MRMAFGLVSVLVAMGAVILIISNFYAPHTQLVLTEGTKAREEAQQIAGYGKDGLKAMDTITLEPEIRSGKVDNIIVTSIVTGGAMEQYYGLKKDDCIIGTVNMDLRGMTDPALAKDLVLDAYQRKHELIVLRNGDKIRLPQAPVPAAGAPAAKGSTGSNSGSSDPIQSQLNAIQRVPN